MRQQEDAARGCGKQQEVAGSSRKQYVLSTTKHTNTVGTGTVGIVGTIDSTAARNNKQAKTASDKLLSWRVTSCLRGGSIRTDTTRGQHTAPALPAAEHKCRRSPR